MHQGLLDRRPDVGAVVHRHSRHATILACASKPIPAVRPPMVAVSGGVGVPVQSPSTATFGSNELAEIVVETLAEPLSAAPGGRSRCPGRCRAQPGFALAIAEEIEEQCGGLLGNAGDRRPTTVGGREMGSRISPALQILWAGPGMSVSRSRRGGDVSRAVASPPRQAAVVGRSRRPSVALLIAGLQPVILGAMEREGRLSRPRSAWPRRSSWMALGVASGDCGGAC
ncbi:class II aldolase/adducin family protein [Caulobacter segnis]